MRRYLIVGSSGQEYSILTEWGRVETIQGLQELDFGGNYIGELIRPSDLLIRHFNGKAGYLFPSGYYEVVDNRTGELRNIVNVSEIMIVDRYGNSEEIAVSSLNIQLICTWALLRDAGWD